MRLTNRLNKQTTPALRNDTSRSASGVSSAAITSAAIAVQRFPVGRNEESLSKAEIGLMLAALSTLLCSIMLGVLIP